MPQIKAVIDSILETQMGKTVAVPLSAGIDSNSILFSCVEKGVSCVAFSFRMDTHESRDFKVARANAKAFNIPFVEVVIPSSLESIQDDLRLLESVYGCKKKTSFECTRVMLYLYKAVQEAGIDTIVSGLGAGYVYLESKKASLHFKHKPDEFRAIMRAKVKDRSASQLHQHDILCEQYAMTHLMPYMSDPMFNTFQGKTWDECNKGTAKKPAKRDYQYYLELDAVKVYAPESYQGGDSGISKSFEILLTSNWNIRSCRTVVAIYNDLIAGKL